MKFPVHVCLEMGRASISPEIQEFSFERNPRVMQENYAG